MASIMNQTSMFPTGNSSLVNMVPIPVEVISFVQTAWSATKFWQVLVTLILVAAAYDQYMYIKQKGSIAGPMWKTPFMGPFLQSIKPKWSGYIDQWNRGPLSCVSIFHKFVIMVSDRDLARKVFNSPHSAKPCLVDVAPQLFGPSSWVFLIGKAHVDFRKGLTALFTRQALETYLPTQDKVFAQFNEMFAKVTEEANGKPVPYMAHFRHYQAAISCRAFVGEYVTDAEIKTISDDLYCMTAAMDLVNVPFSIYIPYSRVWKGKKAAQAVERVFTKAASKSRTHIEAGGDPHCIVDQWMIIIVESQRYHRAVAAGETHLEKPKVLLREFSDFEIAQVLLTFLFASQDATSSATTYLFQIMAQNPEMLDKVRDEAMAVRKGDRHASVTLADLESMTYTNAVVKELLRYRPPVIFVPYVTTKPLAITPTYTAPKGVMVIPTCYPALHDPEVYPEPDTFEPERWITGTANEQTKNWLVFGTGPHQCIAQQYVPMTLVGMISKAAIEVDWVHHPTPTSEEIKVFACLFPLDHCPLTFTRRP